MYPVASRVIDTSLGYGRDLKLLIKCVSYNKLNQMKTQEARNTARERSEVGKSRRRFTDLYGKDMHTSVFARGGHNFACKPLSANWGVP